MRQHTPPVCKLGRNLYDIAAFVNRADGAKAILAKNIRQSRLFTVNLTQFAEISALLPQMSNLPRAQKQFIVAAVSRKSGFAHRSLSEKPSARTRGLYSWLTVF